MYSSTRLYLLLHFTFAFSFQKSDGKLAVRRLGLMVPWETVSRTLKTSESSMATGGNYVQLGEENSSIVAPGQDWLLLCDALVQEGLLHLNCLVYPF